MHREESVAIRWPYFTAALLLTVIVLIVHRQTYWRPFDDTPEESTVSCHAYGFAAASTVDLFPNPIVARHVDVRLSQVNAYPHWPNGFFLILEGALRVFGRTERVGRSVAIIGTLLGFALVMISLGRRGLLLYATLPLILLSADGRDSIPFVFNDAALYASIGALLWASLHLTAHRHFHLIFRLILVAALFLNQLVAPYAAVILLLKWRETRSTRQFLIDVAVLGVAGTAILVGIAAGAEGLHAGFGELLRIFRFNAQRPAQPWLTLLESYLRETLNLGVAGVILVPSAWLVAMVARQWRTVILLPSFILFAILLPQYTTVHHFPRVLFVFFSLLTLATGVGLALERLKRRSIPPQPLTLAALALAGFLAVRLAAVKPQYQPDPHIRQTRQSLMRIVGDPANAAALARCNAFDFRFEQGHHYFHEYHPAIRIGQFFFGRQVAERVRRGAPVRRCLVDLVDHTIREGLEH